MDSLGLDIDQSLLTGEEGVSLQTLLNRVSAVGLPKEFVRKRLVPRRLWSSSPESEGAEGTVPINATAETIGKIFQWSPQAAAKWRHFGVRARFGQRAIQSCCQC